tara:strand:+ start:415 stop:1416 length:1002 start_codon:yes stop_codon:yes gene_type:complete
MNNLDSSYDVVGIGNAIVDVISHENEEFLLRHDLVKNSMSLVDEQTALAIYNDMRPAIQTSGGSAANTMAGIASLGASTGYIGKVRNDQLGELFVHDIEAAGVDHLVAPASTGLPTARSMVLVTPDGARTMNTFLGASSTLYTEDIDTEKVATSNFLYCEGYIWDIETTKNTIRLAMSIAKEANRKVSFTLSDTFCVERHHKEWLELVAGPIDVLFGNEAEYLTLSGCNSIEDAVKWVSGQVEIACITEAHNGSTVVTEGQTIDIEAYPVEKVVDSTGAGDLYAAGFLYGLTKQYDFETCGRIGSLAAAEVITQTGARPQSSLAEIVSTTLDL